MKQFLILTALLSLALVGCKSDSKQQFNHAGGTFVYAIKNEPTTFLARHVNDVYSSVVISQSLEGLTCLDPKTLEVQPGLAKSWEYSEDGLSITFNLRDDVYFHDNDLTGADRKFTAEDVKYSIELACKKSEGEEPSHAYASNYEGSLVGAKEFHNGEADEISGISIEEGKVTLQLLKKDIYFVDKMAISNMFIVLKEMVEAGRENELVGTGPFIFESYAEDDDEKLKIKFSKNTSYYLKDDEGNALPYLDALTIIVEENGLKQLEMFEKGVTHMIDGLPPSKITNMLEGKMEDFNATPPKLVLRRKPLLGTQYYYFNLTKELFQDIRVRKAINYAIDKEDIVRNVLNNQAYGIGDAGIVPPAVFNGYNANEIREVSYTFDLEKARSLLAEAGYPNGEGFPTIELKFNLGNINSAVADRFAKQMRKHLNINVNLEGMTFDRLIHDQAMAKGDIFRMAWYADFFSPENFLNVVYGKTVPESLDLPSLVNHSRFVNEDFDKAFEAGQEASDITERYKHFEKAEKILMQEAPLMILWYEETIKVAYSKVRNLEFNEMNLYSFVNVYIQEWTEEEYLESLKEKK